MEKKLKKHQKFETEKTAKLGVMKVRSRRKDEQGMAEDAGWFMEKEENEEER